MGGAPLIHDIFHDRICLTLRDSATALNLELCLAFDFLDKIHVGRLYKVADEPVFALAGNRRSVLDEIQEIVPILFDRVELPVEEDPRAIELYECFPWDAVELGRPIDHDAHGVMLGKRKQFVRAVINLPAADRHGAVGGERDPVLI